MRLPSDDDSALDGCRRGPGPNPLRGHAAGCPDVWDLRGRASDASWS